MVWRDNIPLAAEPITSLPYVGGKIARLLSMKKEMGFKAYWDGACSGDKIRKFAPMGMDGFVLGTTMLFGNFRKTHGRGH